MSTGKISVSDLCNRLRQQHHRGAPGGRECKYHTAPSHFSGRIAFEIGLDQAAPSVGSSQKSKTLKPHSPPSTYVDGFGSGAECEIENETSTPTFSVGFSHDMCKLPSVGSNSGSQRSYVKASLPQNTGRKVESPSGTKEGTPPSLRPLLGPLQHMPPTQPSDSTNWNGHGFTHPLPASQLPVLRMSPIATKSTTVVPNQAVEYKKLKQKLQDHFRQHAQSSNLFEDLESKSPSIRDATTQTLTDASTQTIDEEFNIPYLYPLSDTKCISTLEQEPSQLHKHLSSSNLTSINASTNTPTPNNTFLSLPTPPIPIEQPGQPKWPTATASVLDKHHQRSFSDSQWPPQPPQAPGSAAPHEHASLPSIQLGPSQGTTPVHGSTHAYQKAANEGRYGSSFQTSNTPSHLSELSPEYLLPDGKHHRSRSDSHAWDDSSINKESERCLEKGIARRNSLSRRIPNTSPQTWQGLQDSLDDIQEEVRKIIRQAKTLERQISGMELRTRAPAPRPYQMMYGGGGSSDDENFITDDEEEYDNSLSFEDELGLGLTDSCDSSISVEDDTELLLRGRKFVSQPPHAGCRPRLLRSSSEEWMSASSRSPDRLKYVPIQTNAVSAFGTSKHLSVNHPPLNLSGTL
ncbi:hypothetical protein Pelo_10373 [Pelomyxa schiedti]|nr:hypothetical protein Pelo_10373 [Pelomyxa schiedti]